MLSDLLLYKKVLETIGDEGKVDNKIEHLAQVLFESRGGRGSVLESNTITAHNSVLDAGLAWYALKPKEQTHGG